MFLVAAIVSSLFLARFPSTAPLDATSTPPPLTGSTAAWLREMVTKTKDAATHSLDMLRNPTHEPSLYV